MLVEIIEYKDRGIFCWKRYR